MCHLVDLVFLSISHVYRRCTCYPTSVFLLFISLFLQEHVSQEPRRAEGKLFSSPKPSPEPTTHTQHAPLKAVPQVPLLHSLSCPVVPAPLKLRYLILET